MQTLVAFLASIVIRLLCFTWRVRLLGPQPDYSKGPLIFCFWHGRQAGLFAHPRPKKVAVLSSLSKDGSLQAKILSNLGFVISRGSSSKGGASGLKSLIQTINQGNDAAFAVDGPKGPINKVKPGAISAAKSTGATVIPITTNARRAWIFKNAWDNYLLPKPFAKVDLIRGEAISVSNEAKATVQLETALLRLGC